ncbi:hypothetical protein MASR2M78_13490 [Treponema sp.]
MHKRQFIFGIDGGGTCSRLMVAELHAEPRASELQAQLRALSSKEALTGEALPGQALPLSRALSPKIELPFTPVYQVEGKSSNVNAVGDAGVERNLRLLFDAAQEAGYPRSSFIAGCLGAAGAGREAERRRVEQTLRAALGATALGTELIATPVGTELNPRLKLSVVSDHEIALIGGLRSNSGFLLLSGTGSIAYARASDGTSFRAGGLGHWLSDEGSGFFVGFTSLSRSIRSSENRDLDTQMLPALLDLFKLSSVADAIPFIYKNFDKTAIAKAAPLVAEFRDRGDELATDIYEKAAQELALLCRSVYQRSQKLIQDHRLLLWGSMLEKDLWLKKRVEVIVVTECPSLILILSLGNAMEGACISAAELAVGSQSD